MWKLEDNYNSVGTSVEGRGQLQMCRDKWRCQRTIIVNQSSFIVKSNNIKVKHCFEYDLMIYYI